jgi:hypothetical protein
VVTVLDGMIRDFERATGPWLLEWVSRPESFLLTAPFLAKPNSCSPAPWCMNGGCLDSVLILFGEPGFGESDL